MSIRRTIILLTLPLFIVLALVNGALLYYQERAEMSQALAEQALTAAVTGAEFISALDAPRDRIAQPERAKALQMAAGHVEGLDGLYFVAPGSPPHALVEPVRPWVLHGMARPAAAHALPAAADASGHRYVVAVAPAKGGAFVAARIDAEPMFAHISAIRGTVLVIVLVAGLTATALSIFVARRITRELDRNSQAIAAIAAGQAPDGGEDLTIRETRDLASAVRLMDASSKAAAERARRMMRHGDRERTLDSALAATRAAHFAPVVATIAGAQVAARICGDAPLGSFFALRADGDRGLVAVGRCRGASPQEAFARAAAARRFLEGAMPGALAAEVIAAARGVHEIEEIAYRDWSSDLPLPAEAQLLASADTANAARAARFAEHNRDAAPTQLVEGIELLLKPVGVFAAAAKVQPIT